MAPNLSGIAAADAARMSELVELAIEFARAHLVPRAPWSANSFTAAATASS
jgi:23S rRNA (uridine2552-2'-O)-methyltransferase